MRTPPIAVLGLAGIVAASALGLAALAGSARHLFPTPLTAEVQLHDFVMPAAVAIDRNVLSEGLLRQIRLRAESDVALRMTLDDQTRAQLDSLIIPRLVNPSVTSRLIEDVSALSAVIELADYQSAAEITVANRTGAPLEDVVVTLPAVLQAEDRDGARFDLLSTPTGLAAIRIGTLEANGSRSLTAWLGQPVAELQARDADIRVGAADGVNGRVYLFGRTGWLGRDLETFLWARWVVGFLVACAGLLAAGTLGLMAFSRPRVKRAD